MSSKNNKKRSKNSDMFSSLTGVDAEYFAFEKMALNADVVDLLMQLMEEKDNMSRKHVSRLLGITEAYLSNVFSGHKLVNIDFMAKIQRVFKKRIRVFTYEVIKNMIAVAKEEVKRMYEYDVAKLKMENKKLREKNEEIVFIHAMTPPPLISHGQALQNVVVASGMLWRSPKLKKDYEAYRLTAPMLEGTYGWGAQSELEYKEI